MSWAGDLWNSITDLGAEEVDLYRLAGFYTSGNHNVAVFEEPETVELVIRPWQSDMAPVRPEGQLGQTPGKKVYAPEDLELRRNDRFHYRGGPFRLMNPQFDQFNDLERWDAQTDERELITTDDPDLEGIDLTQYGEDRYGDYG